MPNAPKPTSILVNGINGRTGRYGIEPLKIADVARAIRGEPPETAGPKHVLDRGRKLTARSFDRGLPFGVAPDNIARAGWAVVFHADEDPKVREALKPLIEHRRRQVGDDTRVKELVYHTDESSNAWLARHDVSWGSVAPERIPYYLLFAGSPTKLPFKVTHELDSDYALGLLHFDKIEDYARYAESVIAYEDPAKGVANKKEIVYFGTRHAFDEATQLSADWLVGPLADGAGSDPAVASQVGFRQRKILAEAATREALLRELEGVATRPAVLFTATHGMVWPNGDPQQRAAQGALLCQDWPGFGSVQPQHFLAGADVPDTANVHGLIAFHFACYGGGTPREDLYHFERRDDAFDASPAIAPEPFVADLPRRLLAHPRGCALACIAHIERAWGSSIVGIASSPQIRAFQVALAQILVGKPVGVAVQEFNDLSAKLSEVLAGMLERVARKQPVDDADLVTTWTARNDAGGFVLIGDPAVRLRVNDLF
jgi:hypothetical protein